MCSRRSWEAYGQSSWRIVKCLCSNWRGRNALYTDRNPREAMCIPHNGGSHHPPTTNDYGTCVYSKCICCDSFSAWSAPIVTHLTNRRPSRFRWVDSGNRELIEFRPHIGGVWRVAAPGTDARNPVTHGARRQMLELRD